MKKYRVDQFKSCGHMIDYFEDRMSALNFGIMAARSTFSGPVFLLKLSHVSPDGVAVYEVESEVKA